MERVKTRFTNKIGDDEYPIYLTIDKDGELDIYNLECEFEIYALVWFDILTKSIEDYNKDLEEL